jgi:hypothetical protein
MRKDLLASNVLAPGILWGGQSSRENGEVDQDDVFICAQNSVSCSRSLFLPTLMVVIVPA